MTSSKTLKKKGDKSKKARAQHLRSGDQQDVLLRAFQGASGHTEGFFLHGPLEGQLKLKTQHLYGREVALPAVSQKKEERVFRMLRHMHRGWISKACRVLLLYRVPDFFGFLGASFLLTLGLCFLWVLFCVWSCVPCLHLCEVDDHAGGALDAADDAEFDVAGDQAAGVDDAVDDVVDDDKEADGDISIITINSNVTSGVINTSSLIISHIKTSSIKSTIRMIVNIWQNVAQQFQEVRSMLQSS